MTGNTQKKYQNNNRPQTSKGEKSDGGLQKSHFIANQNKQNAPLASGPGQNQQSKPQNKMNEKPQFSSSKPTTTSTPNTANPQT